MIQSIRLMGANGHEFFLMPEWADNEDDDDCIVLMVNSDEDPLDENSEEPLAILYPNDDRTEFVLEVLRHLGERVETANDPPSPEGELIATLLDALESSIKLEKSSGTPNHEDFGD